MKLAKLDKICFVIWLMLLIFTIYIVNHQYQASTGVFATEDNVSRTIIIFKN